MVDALEVYQQTAARVDKYCGRYIGPVGLALAARWAPSPPLKAALWVLDAVCVAGGAASEWNPISERVIARVLDTFAGGDTAGEVWPFAKYPDGTKVIRGPKRQWNVANPPSLDMVFEELKLEPLVPIVTAYSGGRSAEGEPTASATVEQANLNTPVTLEVHTHQLDGTDDVEVMNTQITGPGPVRVDMRLRERPLGTTHKLIVRIEGAVRVDSAVSIPALVVASDPILWAIDRNDLLAAGYSDTYCIIREKFINDFLFGGFVASMRCNERRDDGGVEHVEFSDQSAYMGHALISFSLEARRLREKGLPTQSPEAAISSILSAFGHMDHTADIHFNGYDTPGFFYRDAVTNDLCPGWQVKSDYISALTENDDSSYAMSVDQVIHLFIGFLAVSTWTTKSHNLERVFNYTSQIMDFLISRDYEVDRTPRNRVIPEHRGPHYWWASGWLSKIATLVTGFDYFHYPLNRVGSRSAADAHQIIAGFVHNPGLLAAGQAGVVISNEAPPQTDESCRMFATERCPLIRGDASTKDGNMSTPPGGVFRLPAFRSHGPPYRPPSPRRLHPSRETVS